MSTATSTGHRRSDLALVWSELKYEQRAFWRNPFAAAFSVGFSVVFLVLLGLSGGNDRISFLGNVRTVQYYVPGFLAYGVMATCFNVLAITLVGRRELGLLKRLAPQSASHAHLLRGLAAQRARREHAPNHCACC